MSEDKVRTLYVRVFQEFFSATSLQPIDEDEFEKALEFSMKEHIGEDDKKEIMKMFVDQDEDNTGALNITQVKNVLTQCVERNLFTNFFDDDDVNLKKYAQKLVDDIFIYVYEDEDDIDETTFLQTLNIIPEECDDEIVQILKTRFL
jgi:hypothetical protein